MSFVVPLGRENEFQTLRTYYDNDCAFKPHLFVWGPSGKVLIIIIIIIIASVCCVVCMSIVV